MIAVIIARAVVYVVLVHHAAFAAVFIYPVHSYSFKTFFCVSIDQNMITLCMPVQGTHCSNILNYLCS